MTRATANRKTWRRTLAGHEAIIERWGRRDVHVRIGSRGFFLFLPWREAREVIDAELVLASAEATRFTSGAPGP